MHRDLGIPKGEGAIVDELIGDQDEHWATTDVVIDVRSGEVRWRQPTAFISAPAMLAGGRLLLPDGSDCWSLDPVDGTGIRLALGVGERQEVNWQPVPWDGTRYRVTEDGALVAVGVDAQRLVATTAR